MVRIEDLDRERCIPGLSDQFLQTLERFGFQWDGKVEFQSHRNDFYQTALARLGTTGMHYACSCSRSSLAHLTAEPGQEPVYPGTCRDKPPATDEPHALRFRIAPDTPVIRFEDRIQGPVSQDCRHEAGDFVIRRRNGEAAYHLAVVVDDELQGITEVVRGADLLTCTPRQILLQQSLGFRSPQYAHLPLLTEPDGRKLAKSRRAVPLAPERAGAQLCLALGWLGMEPPEGLVAARMADIWSWALSNWQEASMAGRREWRLPGREQPEADGS